MQKKNRKTSSFMLVLLTFIGVTILLYGMGALFSIEWLMLESSFHAGNEGFSFHRFTYTNCYGSSWGWTC
ncbi:hypothetical protein MM326_02710 [Alkalihalobacillus sp. LMS6]|uniref:hypothetical protein n=1 Tax=Alkalihalobacillus sp. LMS6 TaxID=2924034 RepID=UPI0020D1C0D3|nr:hypothetical protein [Alkalihalobacillus sp. LMS6]UTR06961.1 hypothetical protein MM326_02710 [Alkalihalobacillus sp. LMS6]